MEAAPLQSQVDTLLIIDDEPLITDLFRDYMTRRGFQVLTAPGGPEGLELLKQAAGRVRLVITDMSLPGMNGLEVALAIEAHDPQLPVIIATGHDRTGTEFPHNVVEVVQKPYQNRVLAERIRQIIDARTAERSAEG